MPFDYETLETMRLNHPAWRLLRADHAPLIVSFLHRVFIASNVRDIAQGELIPKLEDDLFHLREVKGDNAFPKEASAYLNEWAQDNSGWLRKYYPPGSDEPHFDITPATEKAFAWLESLTQRAFVGTESRLLTVFELLRQIVSGSQTDPELRIGELKRRKGEIEAEIARIRGGDFTTMDDTALRERFEQLASTARELLGDFRQVEENFRILDRKTREQITQWEGAKGGLLETIFGERDAIADSDQGKSFRAFWDFLMAPERQDELSGLLEKVFELPAIRTGNPNTRLKRVHYDWLEAGEHTQRTVALLSQQLRRFLDDQVWLENRRIMEILHQIEANALAVRDCPPPSPFMEIDDLAPAIELPMERPLFSPPLQAVISQQVLPDGHAEGATDALFNQVVVDKAVLAARVRQALQTKEQITLAQLLLEFPLEMGLAELIGYLAMASQSPLALFDDSHNDLVQWMDEKGVTRNADLPRVIFTKGRKAG